MPMESRFFNAKEVIKQDESGNDITVYDRTYYAEDFAGYFYKLVNDGIFAQPADQLQVMAKSGLTILVKAGAAWIEGYMGELKEDEEFTLVPNISQQTQIVKVVCVLLRNERKVDIQIVQGAESINPVNDGTRHELVLATFNLPVGTSAITDAMIADRRFQDSFCGIVAGMVQNISTTDLFKQYDDMFNTWFNGLKDLMTDNVASNLQNQISDLQNQISSVSNMRIYDGYYVSGKIRCVINGGDTITISNSYSNAYIFDNGQMQMFINAREIPFYSGSKEVLYITFETSYLSESNKYEEFKEKLDFRYNGNNNIDMMPMYADVSVDTLSYDGKSVLAVISEAKLRKSYGYSVIVTVKNIKSIRGQLGLSSSDKFGVMLTLISI